MTAYTNKPEQITALYARLSQEDALDGDSNSIVDHDVMYRGGLHQKTLHHDWRLHLWRMKKTVMIKEGMPSNLP